MQFHKQRYRHRPEQGEFGDCCRTVYACLLDMDPEQIPNFGIHYGDPDAFHRLEREWLNAQGYTTFTSGIDGQCSLDEALEFTTRVNGQALVMLTGTSRTGVNHVVIVKDGVIIHDPHPDDVGIVGPASDGTWRFEVLVPLCSHEASS